MGGASCAACCSHSHSFLCYSAPVRWPRILRTSHSNCVLSRRLPLTIRVDSSSQLTAIGLNGFRFFLTTLAFPCILALECRPEAVTLPGRMQRRARGFG